MLKYVCKDCDKQLTTRDGLKLHKLSIHEGVRYFCDKCAYKTSKKGDLNVHLESVHKGILYPCNQCGFKATTNEHLIGHFKKHVEINNQKHYSHFEMSANESQSSQNREHHIESNPHMRLNDKSNVIHDLTK